MKLQWHKGKLNAGVYIATVTKYEIQGVPCKLTMYIERYHDNSCWFGSFRYNDSSLIEVGVSFDTLRQVKHWFQISLNNKEI